MKTFFKVVVSGFITGVIASLLSGCSVSQEEPSDVAAFYQVFVEDATSMDLQKFQDQVFLSNVRSRMVCTFRRIISMQKLLILKQEKY